MAQACSRPAPHESPHAVITARETLLDQVLVDALDRQSAVERLLDVLAVRLAQAPRSAVRLRVFIGRRPGVRVWPVLNLAGPGVRVRFAWPILSFNRIEPSHLRVDGPAVDAEQPGDLAVGMPAAVQRLDRSLLRH